MDDNKNINPNFVNMMDNMNLNNNMNFNNMNMNNMNMNNMNMNNMNMNNMNFNNMNNMNMNNYNMMQMQYMMMLNSGVFNGQNFNFGQNDTPNNPEITINVQLNEQKIVQVKFSQDKKISELISKIRADYKIFKFFKLMVKGKPLVNSMTLGENNLENGANVQIIFLENRNDDQTGYIKRINMIFNINNPNKFEIEKGSDLSFIAKVCYLKEISSRLNDENIGTLPEKIAIIVKLLKKGKIEKVDSLKDESKEILESIRQTNLLNLAHYINQAINSTHIQNMLNLLNEDDLKQMKIFKHELLKIDDKIRMFDKDFLMARKKSVFEYSLIGLEINNRPDIENYEKAVEKCPNVNERILYQGTSEENISNILKNHFKFSQRNIFGKGVYFSNSLDLSCICTRESFNNHLKLPEVNEVFSFIVSSVFYNNNTRKRVEDNSYTPKKNEVNIAIVDGKLNSIKKQDNSHFYSREYIIGELCQIFPFMQIKIKRNEYCVIWRDNNLSSKPVYNDKYDKEFKDFLKNRLEYISQYAKFNIYPCETTKEALTLVKKKKFNKIILMSNVGSDFGGRDFVNEARKIIGNDVITLFLAYMEEHLEWITEYNNALFSNIDKFHEQYLECFTDDPNATKQNILTLKSSIEDHYDVKFKFDNKFLDFPNFKEEGEFCALNF